MTQWLVRYVGTTMPVIVEAPTFAEAVTKAMQYAESCSIGETDMLGKRDPIMSIQYFNY